MWFCNFVKSSSQKSVQIQVLTKYNFDLSLTPLWKMRQKRILERLEIQTSSSFDKIWFVCNPEFKANFLFIMACFFLSGHCWSYLDHNLMVSIWENVVSILVEIWIQVVVILLQLEKRGNFNLFTYVLFSVTHIL